MRLINPAMLFWGLLVLVPIVMYLFRRKPKTVRVSTLLFFKALAREHQESAWLRRLKRLLSLLLSILIILAAVAGLARPVVAPEAGSLKSVVILLDRSASMASRDESGRTRLDAALDRLRQRLAGLPASVPVAVMIYDRRPRILLPPSFDRREVERVLSDIRVRPVAGQTRGALRLARELAALETPASVWHVTDGLPVTLAPDPGAVTPADGKITVEHIGLALDSPINAGLTAFQLRALPLEHGRLEAFVQIHAVSPAPVETKLELRLDGKLVAMRSMTVKPGGRERLLIPVKAGEGEVLSLKVTTPGDVLALDDEVHARVPQPPPIRVLWIRESPDPFTRLALASITESQKVRVFQGGPASWPAKPEPDVVIFDGWLPKTWPAGPSVVVIDPPGSAGPVRAARLAGAGLPLSSVRPTDQRHPVLYGVASARVALTQTAVVEAEGPLQPLWVGPSGPILLAGEVRGQRLVVMAFAPRKSERLPLMASYPLLIGNAIYWSARPKIETRGAQGHKTGELIALQGEKLTWTLPGPREAGREIVPIEGRWTELDRQGLWETDAGQTGSAALLSVRETVLAAAPAEGGDAPRTGRWGFLSASLFRGDLTWLFLWAVLAFLLVESLLYHRKAVN